MTLIEAREQFINHLKEQHRASATILAYSKDIEQLIDYLNKLDITDPTLVSTENLSSFMAKLAKESYTPKSVSRKTNSTKTFFKFLKTNGIIKEDVASGLEHPTFENKPARVLSVVEYRALRDAARGDIRISAIIELLLQTGIRIGELAKLTVEDVKPDPENPSIHVPKAEASVERIVPLTRPALEAVEKYLQIRNPKQSKNSSLLQSKNSSLFITKTGRPLLVRNIRTAIDRYFKLAGIERARVNDLRHTWVVSQLSSGISLALVSKLSGHKRISTTEKYLQYVPGRASEDKIQLEEL